MMIEDIWGTFEVERKYLEIIASKEFSALKNKSQLGLNSNPNAIHTRYQHSLGVYFLACKLIEICKRKFGNIIDIKEEDVEAIKCMALVHDIGHGAFSHVSEKFLEGTHEERAVVLLTNPDTEIHKAIVSTFGLNVLNKVINLIEMKNQKETFDDSLDLMFIMRKLLAGGIDIDRIDYIYRDSKQVLGSGYDFSSILEAIDLEYIDDNIEIVFDGTAEYTIANFFNKRFELYDTGYLSNETRVIESIFQRFINNTGIKLSWDTTEIKLKNYFEEFANRQEAPEIIKRDAKILLNRALDNKIIYKEINDEEDYNLFKKRIETDIPELQKVKNSLLESCCAVDVYSEKNKVYIKKDGVILDLSLCSKILNPELKKKKYIIAIDFENLTKELLKQNISKEKITKILAKIKEMMANEIEQEKKFTFNELSLNPQKDFEQIKDFMHLGVGDALNNNDVYYDYLDILSKHKINVRHRSDKKGEVWTLKKPLVDQTSICKRTEKNFANLDGVINYLQKEVGLEITFLEEQMTLNTHRTKYNLTCFGGTFELVFDETIPEKDGINYQPGYMIEVELKSGSSVGLYFITKALLQFPFIEECNLSKKEIAEETIRKESIGRSRKREK